jgi:hypothetical protein
MTDLPCRGFATRTPRCPLGTNALKQGTTGRFVVGDLRHQLAGESGFEDIFALGVGLFEGHFQRLLFIGSGLKSAFKRLKRTGLLSQ